MLRHIFGENLVQIHANTFKIYCVHNVQNVENLRFDRLHDLEDEDRACSQVSTAAGDADDHSCQR